MSSKVTLKITRGEKQGEVFEYTEQARVLIGRQDDCTVRVPENTVSRYHCLLEIMPPHVRLQDFGSLNGTYLNGKLIGRRERTMSWEEAKEQHHDSFDLHDGDTLGLGTQCEITCAIETKETCPLCGADLPDAQADVNATVLISAELPSVLLDDQGRRICESCWNKLQKKKKAAEAAAKKPPVPRKPKPVPNDVPKQPPQPVEDDSSDDLPDGKRICVGCSKPFTPTAEDNNLCPACLADRAKVLSGVLAMLNINAKKAQQKEKTPPPAGPAPQKQPPQKKEPLKPSILTGYEKVSLLGKGGMGEVWKVRESATGKEFALKTMLPDVSLDPQAKRLFLREAGISECLRHPNVVKAYKTGSANGVLFILMDLCEGGSADDLIKKSGGKLSLELATWITLQCLSGLDYVHNMDVDAEIRAGLFRGTKEVSVKGVVHRDFKPGNIFLSDRSDHPTAMVADFGMAKAFSVAGQSQISKTGAVMGTPVFMPKQQARDCKYAKPEVDVWAAAASYYYMLTGQFVKNYRPSVNVWQVLITEPAVPIRDRNRNIPSALAEVIDRALVENPRLYYSSAAAFRKDLVAALPAGVRTYCKGIL